MPFVLSLSEAKLAKGQRRSWRGVANSWFDKLTTNG
jgi:hypothetical protein